MASKSNRRELEEATAIEFVNAIFNDSSHLRKHYKSSNMIEDTGEALQRTIDMHNGAKFNLHERDGDR
jgi:hypothetical protein